MTNGAMALAIGVAALLADDPRWAYRPLIASPLPAESADPWVNTRIDGRLLSARNEAGLAAQEVATKTTLLRRATFDLTGLPPSEIEIDRFLADDAPDSFDRVIDRLLASPAYAEKWARHWLDVVAYAETDGHERDPDKAHAHLYRDYVIEAIATDLPFDRFMAEHLAGDRHFPARRLDRTGSAWAGPVATGFWWLTEAQPVPVDVLRARADRVEKQLDVFGKAFLGQTVACARCHDHKFDPIPSKDYYALAGFLASSRQAPTSLDTPERMVATRAIQRRLEEFDAEIEGRRAAERMRRRQQQVRSLPAILRAVAALSKEDTDAPARIAVVAKRFSVEPAELEAWRRFLGVPLDQVDPVFIPIARLRDTAALDFSRLAKALGEQLVGLAESPFDGNVFMDFSGATFDKWSAIGGAFGEGPTARDGPGGERFADSGRYAPMMTGRLLSPPFRLGDGFISLRVRGDADRSRLTVQLVENGQPLPKLAATGPGQGRTETIVLDARELSGRTARIEILDDSPEGWIAVGRIAFHDATPASERKPNHYLATLLRDNPPASADQLADWYGHAFSAALATAHGPTAQRGVNELVAWLVAGPHPFSEQDKDSPSVAALVAKREALARQLTPSTLAIVTEDGPPIDAAIEALGDPHSPGEIAPRGALSAIDQLKVGAPLTGSGRLELAHWLIDPSNPLPARVIVNRIWQHHFGRGLVATPDNFGALGARPSHPELLDDLARRFIDEGWSLKYAHRLMMRSRTYQLSSRASALMSQVDPENRLLGRMPIRRLEAEEVRDAMLAAAGILNTERWGRGIPLHVTPFMEGRDVPGYTGPLDGDRRRSVYLAARRNHREPLLTAFDAPATDACVGRRPVSTSPSQSLSLLNDPFVRQTAERWGERLATEGAGRAEEVIEKAFVRALGRRPTAVERKELAAFLASRRDFHRASDASGAEVRAWSDFAHTLFNLGEFVALF